MLLTSAVVMIAGCDQMPSPVSPTSASSSAAVSSAATDASLTLTSRGHAVPFQGRVAGTVTLTLLDPPFAGVDILATGTANHLGRFSLDMPHQVNLVSATGVGTMTFTAANGDRLTATFTGHADTSSAVFVIAEHAIVTGGTGRFAGATGSFDLERLYDTVANTTTGTFDGQLLLP